MTPTKQELIIAAGKFKATCLQLLDAAEQGETITITKRGRVVARLVPPEPEKPQEFVPLSGRMKGKGKVLGDIVGPDYEPGAWKTLAKARRNERVSSRHARLVMAAF